VLIGSGTAAVACRQPTPPRGKVDAHERCIVPIVSILGWCRRTREVITCVFKSRRECVAFSSVSNQ